jgi:tetratricopeptide (TPR) repeat protein
MKTSRTLTTVCITLLVICMAVSMMVTHKVEQIRHGQVLREMLWIPSAETVKRMSLGYDGLVADLYWTRVVQYFGGQHKEDAKTYELLKPLLDITTTLDPKLLVAYEFGGVFLAQDPPEGAGNPQAAADLMKKGIKANPEAWRLWYNLGFIYWQELNDPAKASEAFQQGSEVPGAHPWMRIMAASLAQHADQRETARYLWTNIMNSTQDELVKDNAKNRLLALQIDELAEKLQARVDDYTKAVGRPPRDFQQLVAEGWMRGIPRDPKGKPFEILNGHVQLANHKDFPFVRKALPAGYEASDLPKIPSK